MAMKLEGHLLCVDRSRSGKAELTLKLLENRPTAQIFLVCPTVEFNSG